MFTLEKYDDNDYNFVKKEKRRKKKKIPKQQ